MQTAKALYGLGYDIAKYHISQENYYYNQSQNLNEMLSKIDVKGAKYQCCDPEDYLTINGKLCEKFGFKEGENISEETLSRLIDGYDDAGNKINKRRTEMKAIDLTLSAPKSVSIQALVHKDMTVLNAHKKAVAAAMKEIEQHFIFSRQRKGKPIKTDKALIASIDDGFNRNHEPHLHTHNLLFNFTETEDGKITSIASRKILNKDFNALSDSIYKMNLMKFLQEAGYSISYQKDGNFRLDCVSPELEMAFSERRQEIVKAKEAGLSDQYAWAKTRAEKSPYIDKESCVENWQLIENQVSENIKKDMSNIPPTVVSNNNDIDEQIEGEQTSGSGYLAEQARNRERALSDYENWSKKAQFSIEASQERWGRADLTEDEKWQFALRRATDKEALVDEKAIITEYMKEELRQSGDCGSYSEALLRFSRQVEKDAIIYNTKAKKYTSVELIIAEKSYFKFAGKMASENWQKIDNANEIDNFLDKYQGEKITKGERGLSDVQMGGIKTILKNKRMIGLIQGDAGAGKTTAMKAAVEYYKSKGIDVVGVAMQGIAAKNLADETGVSGQTLTSYLAQKDTGTGRVVIFDEASMLDSRSAAKLLEKLRRNGDKLILVGDINQIGAIGAGKPFERLLKDAMAADSGDYAVFDENYRQKDETLRKAVEWAKKGDIEKSLEIIETEHYGLKEVSDYKDRLEKVAAQYDDDTLIVTATNKNRTAINELVRTSQREKGILKTELEQMVNVQYQDADGVMQTKQIALAEGEKIVFTVNNKNYGLMNGERATVLGINAADKTIKVETADKRIIDIDTTKYSALDYGYALTTYKSQGQTYNKVVVEADTSVSSLNDITNTYVKITRTRNKLTIYTDNKKELKTLAKMKNIANDTIGMSTTNRKTSHQQLKNTKAETKSEEIQQNPNTVKKSSSLSQN